MTTNIKPVAWVNPGSLRWLDGNPQDRRLGTYLHGRPVGDYVPLFDQAALDAELAAERERCAWQPIETAPKDGRRVLVWIADQNYTGHAFAKLWFYSTDGRLGGGAEGYNGDWNITHWMELPAPPGEQR